MSAPLRRTLRTLLIAGALGLGTVGGPAQADSRVQSTQLNIPAQPLRDALADFGRQTGLQVVYQAAEVTEVLTAPRVVGTFTARDALTRILSQSGLRYEYLDERTVAIRAIKPSDAADTEDVPSKAMSNDLRLARMSQANDTQRADAATRPERESADENSDGASVQEIIVTAQKKVESAQKVPVSMAVLTGATIEERHFINLADFIRNVPGATFNEYGAGINDITIRGIYKSPTGPATGVYLGEIPLVGLAAYNDPDIKLVDMERVEILRGPQGTLFGSGSMGGTLRYIPNAPDLEHVSGKVDADYGHTARSGADNKSGTAVINVPLVRDKLALRVAGYYYDIGGHTSYIGAQVPSRVALAAQSGATLLKSDNGGAPETTGTRATLMWKPAEAFDATLTYLEQKITQSGFPEDSIHLKPYQDFPLSFGSLTPDGNEERHHRAEIFNLTLHYSLPKVDLVSSTSRVTYDGGETRDASRDGYGALGLIGLGHTDLTSEEIRARTQFSGPVNFLLGVYYEDNDSTGTVTLPWLGSAAACCGLSFFGTDPNDIGHFNEGDHVKQKAVFAEIYYEMTDKLKLTVGGRTFNYDRTRYTYNFGPAFGNAQNLSRTSQADHTLKANASYSFDENSMLYATWAQGFRLGAPNAPLPTYCDTDSDGILDGTTTPLQDHLDPDSLDSYEVGSKSRLAGGRLAMNVAAYQINWKNIATSIPGTCGFFAPVNAGSARVRGVEFDGSLALPHQLTFNLSGSVNSAKILQGAPGFGNPGDELPQSPMQINAGLEHRFNVNGYRSYVRADYGYIAGYRGVIDGTGPKLGDYGTLDVRVGATFDNLTAAVYGVNVTNEVGATTYSVPHRIWHTVPRTVGVQLGYRF